MIFRFFRFWLAVVATAGLFMTSGVMNAALPTLDQFGILESNQPIPSVVAGDVKTLTQDSGMFVEGQPVNFASLPSMWLPVDPAQIYLSQQTNLRMWLVGDGADFRNFTGIGLGGDYTLNDNDKQKVFGDIDLGGIIPFNNPTDRVRHGDVGPDKLDFFLIANGASVEALYQLYWTDMAPKPPVSGADVNADGMEHAMAFLWTDPSDLSAYDFLVYAWEDLPKGVSDFDFNDVFMLVRAEGVVVVPEPSTYLVMGSFLLFVAIAHRRRKVVA